VTQQTQIHRPKSLGFIVVHSTQTEFSASFHGKRVFRELLDASSSHFLCHPCLMFREMRWMASQCMDVTNLISVVRWASLNIKSSVATSPRRASPIPRFTACASSRLMKSLPNHDSGISCGTSGNVACPGGIAALTDVAEN
jgi:hypothetical protein